MINANELRIGNKVHYQRNESITEVVTIIWISDDSAGYKEEHEASYPHSLQCYSGIPLTPQWLERIGMKKRFDSATCNIWDMKDERMRNGNLCLARLERGWVYPTAPGAVPFQYIHQLQNLYFALCGEELTIKETNEAQG